MLFHHILSYILYVCKWVLKLFAKVKSSALTKRTWVSLLLTTVAVILFFLEQSKGLVDLFWFNSNTLIIEALWDRLRGFVNEVLKGTWSIHAHTIRLLIKRFLWLWANNKVRTVCAMTPNSRPNHCHTLMHTHSISSLFICLMYLPLNYTVRTFNWSRLKVKKCLHFINVHHWE